MARKYLIIPTSEIDKVDFSQVCETSEDTLRFSVDGLKTFVKWENDEPAFIASLNETDGPYTNKEILEILSTDVWTFPVDEE
tara:strand:- start:171 stop:416 length:246 start_codon:yes stop_codon:yes gene_type:complete